MRRFEIYRVWHEDENEKSEMEEDHEIIKKKKNITMHLAGFHSNSQPIPYLPFSPTSIRAHLLW
jgi:hypothetical protein